MGVNIHKNDSNVKISWSGSGSGYVFPESMKIRNISHVYNVWISLTPSEFNSTWETG